MNAVASGLSRQRFKPVISNTQGSPMFCDESTTPSTVVSGDEKICDAKPLAMISKNFPNCGSKRPISRLHSLSFICNMRILLYFWNINFCNSGMGLSYFWFYLYQKCPTT